MKAMGLRGGINWLAWFLSSYFSMVLVSFIVSLILKYGGIYPLTDLSIIFACIAVFGFSSLMLWFYFNLSLYWNWNLFWFINFSFFIGSFFSKTNLASLIGILVYFVSYLPFILVMSMKYEISMISKVGLVRFFKLEKLFLLK